MSDLTVIYCFGPTADRKSPLFVWVPGRSGIESPPGSGIYYEDGTRECETSHVHPNLQAGPVNYQQLLEAQGPRRNAMVRQINAFAAEVGLTRRQFAALLGDLGGL